jgi:hypothetical protein
VKADVCGGVPKIGLLVDQGEPHPGSRGGGRRHPRTGSELEADFSHLGNRTLE